MPPLAVARGSCPSVDPFARTLGTETLAILAVTFGACSPTAVGAACERDSDCDTDLVCDVHADRGTCQTAHAHATGSDSHEHSVLELDKSGLEPDVELSIEKDRYEGWNLRVELQDFEFVPAGSVKSGTADQGHAHVYVDGEKITRMYSNWLHLPNLAPGRHEVRVELSSDEHNLLWVNGDFVADSAIIEQQVDGARGDSDGMIEVQTRPVLDFEMVPDATSGWNLQVLMDGFTLAPEHVSEPHVAGEGSLRLYVDGQHRGRVYGAWHYVGTLEAGSQVKLELRSNDQHIIMFDNLPVTAERTVASD